MRIISLWKQPLLGAVQQSRMEWQVDDGQRARLCPVYADACKLPVHLVTSGDITIHWHGGRSFELNYPDWWRESYREERRNWSASKAVPTTTGSPVRFLGETPFGCPKHLAFTHAGGLTLTLFTGLSLRSEQPTLLTSAMNSYATGWRVQDGVYDPHFKGDLSLNIQVMTQDRLFIPSGWPLCSLWQLAEQQPWEQAQPHDGEIAEADAFYAAKATGKSARAIIGCPAHSSP